MYTLKEYVEYVVKPEIQSWPKWKRDFGRLLMSHDSYGEPNTKLLKSGDCNCIKCQKTFSEVKHDS